MGAQSGVHYDTRTTQMGAYVFAANGLIVVDTPFGAGDGDFTIALWIQPTSGSFDGNWHGFIGYQQGTRSPSMWVNHAGGNDGPNDDTGGLMDFDRVRQSGVHYDTRTTQMGDGTRYGGVVDGIFAVDNYVHL